MRAPAPFPPYCWGTADRRGIVLIIVLGVLAVLVLLGTVFATLAGVERELARNYVDEVRARLIAGSGVQQAVGRLEALVRRGFFPSPGGAPDRTWVYYGSQADERRTPDGRTPLEQAVNPSFALEAEDPQNPYDADSQPRTIRVDGEERGLSGTTQSGTYGRNADQIVLRVSDCAGMIYVNEGVARGPDHSGSRNLRRVLNILGAQPEVGVENLGDKVLTGRPAGGYLHKYELLAVLGEDAFARVRDLVTAHAWVDPQVANPVPLSAEVADPALGFYDVSFDRPNGPAGPIHRYGRGRNYVGQVVSAPLLFYDRAHPDPFHHAIYGRDSLHPQWIELVERAPVNINSARREILVALIADLQGFFTVERRRDNPYTPPGSSAVGDFDKATAGYAWLNQTLTYDPGTAAGEPNGEGDETGFIYRTTPFVAPGGKHRDGIPAGVIADEIIACRESSLSPNVANLDYGRAPFGGPFRSWAQFNLFVDHLVRVGLIRDMHPADTFVDLASNGSWVPSPAQARIATQAVADVLKANFNPNLNLNELNPPRALFTLVDKTDLLAHSTEFCFTPMGYFEIESLGRVLVPRGGVDAFFAENRTLAESKVYTVVRLFDAVRETTQADFYAGEFGERQTNPETNNNWAVETGPEPDNGPQPAENSWSGYVTLPTLGGNFFGLGRHKPKGELWTTYPEEGMFPDAAPCPEAGAQFGSSIHAHFQLDPVAHHHRDADNDDWAGYLLPLGGWVTQRNDRISTAMNWPDRTEGEVYSPYSPVKSGLNPAPAPYGHRYRLGRGFKEGPAEAFEYAPSDLRLDGLYCERHSAIGYWITEDSSWNFNSGTAAFWIKPAFDPAVCGKPRALLSMSRFHAYNIDSVNFSPFTLYFFPAHDGASGRPSGVESTAPLYYGGIGKFRPASLGFGVGFHPVSGYNWELTSLRQSNYASLHANVLTPSLNHEHHGADNYSALVGDDGKWNDLRPNQWTHVVVQWYLIPNVMHDETSVRIFINGRIVPGTAGIPSFYGAAVGEPIPFTPKWDVHSVQLRVGAGGDESLKWMTNAIRLGGEFSLPLGDAFSPMEGNVFPRNYTADATFDEFYVWTSQGQIATSSALGLWTRGRYYKADDNDSDDAVFTSQAIDLARKPSQFAGSAPPASDAAPPFPSPVAGDPPGPVPTKRLVGIAWTAHAEDYGRDFAPAAGGRMRPRMLDYRAEPPVELAPVVEPDANGWREPAIADLWVESDGVTRGPYRNDGFSPLCIDLADASDVKYRAKLRIGPKSPGTILLEGPVLEDVTLFFSHGGPEYACWINLP